MIFTISLFQLFKYYQVSKIEIRAREIDEYQLEKERA